MPQPLKGHLNQCMIVGLERDAQVELQNAVGAQQQPVTSARQNLAAKSRPFEVASRDRDDAANAMRHGTELLGRSSGNSHRHQLNALNNEAEWELVSGRRRARVRVVGAIASRDFRSVSFFVDRGHGIGLLPSTYCDSQIENGALVRLLPKWSSPPVSVHAVYPTRRFLPEKVQVFLQALHAWRSPFWISA
jgi:DNA-binding transcriptional LysR family regulator